MKIVYAKEAKERIRHLHPTLKKQIRTALDELKEDPWKGKILQRELTGILSLKVKQYRILYTLEEENKIIILTLGRRKTIYDDFTRGKR